MERVLRLSDCVSRWLDVFTRWVAVPATMFFLILIFISVAARFVFKVPIVSSEEFCRIGFVWACMMGAALCVRNGDHIRFEFLIERLGIRLRYAAELFVWCLFIVFSGTLLYFGLELTLHLVPTTFPASGISQAWLYGSLPLSSAVILVHSLHFALLNLFGLVTGGRASA